MPNKFCHYLSNGYSFNLNKNKLVEVKPCCWYKTPLALDQQLLQNRRLKYDVIDQWTDNCVACKTQEDSGQQSLRQTGPDWIDFHDDSQDPVAIDIYLDNECNAACVTCSKAASSLWKKEIFKLDNKKIKINIDHTFVDRSINDIVNIVSLEKVKYVKFFGGEPLFTDTHLKFLKHIPYPAGVTLHYTTNGSIYPNEETLDVWKKFKTIIFSASLDGIEEQFDYVRWPLPWSKVSNNLIRLKENKDIWNLLFRIEFTANFLNSYYFDRLEHWVNDNLKTNYSGDATEINIHVCVGHQWQLENMPSDIRALALKKYPTDHRIHRLIKNLPPPATLTPWSDFVNTWDTRRKNSWKTAFPDLANYLNV